MERATTARDREAPEAARPPSAGRGTLRGEIGFAAAAIRLALAVVADSLFNVVAAVAFLFFRGAYRKRMRRIILGGPGGAALAAAALGLLGGCAGSRETVPTGDSRSFEGQMQELGWSIHATVDQSDSRKSLEDTLDALQADAHWKDHLRFDIENLFAAPDARHSLEDDLQDLGEPDSNHDHGLKETIRMLGW